MEPEEANIPEYTLTGELALAAVVMLVGGIGLALFLLLVGSPDAIISHVVLASIFVTAGAFAVLVSPVLGLSAVVHLSVCGRRIFRDVSEDPENEHIRRLAHRLFICSVVFAALFASTLPLGFFRKFVSFELVLWYGIAALIALVTGWFAARLFARMPGAGWLRSAGRGIVGVTLIVIALVLLSSI